MKRVLPQPKKLEQVFVHFIFSNTNDGQLRTVRGGKIDFIGECSVWQPKLRVSQAYTYYYGSTKPKLHDSCGRPKWNGL